MGGTIDVADLGLGDLTGYAMLRMLVERAHQEIEWPGQHLPGSTVDPDHLWRRVVCQCDDPECEHHGLDAKSVLDWLTLADGQRHADWAAVLLEQVARVFHALNDRSPDEMRHRLASVAAVACRWSENIDGAHGGLLPHGHVHNPPF